MTTETLGKAGIHEAFPGESRKKLIEDWIGGDYSSNIVAICDWRGFYYILVRDLGVNVNVARRWTNAAAATGLSVLEFAAMRDEELLRYDSIGEGFIEKFNEAFLGKLEDPDQ